MRVAGTHMKLNFAANTLSRVIAGLFNFVAAPLYAHLIGMEGYGLIGIFLTLQGLIQILEVGLTTAASRELARRCVTSECAATTRDYVRTLATLYWTATIGVSLASPLIAGVLVNRWLKFNELSAETAIAAVSALLITVVLQWPNSLYLGALMGLQRQVLANVIYGVGAIARVLATVAALVLISNSVVTFFLVQTAVTVVTIGALAVGLWRALPGSSTTPRFRIALVRSSVVLSAGISGVSLFSTCLNQVDKVILSRYLSMTDFGHYMMAWTLANSLYMLVTPICATVFPSLSQLAAVEDVPGIAKIYSQSTQLVCVLLAPAVIVTMWFPGDILLLWTKDAGTVAKSSSVVAVLMPAVLASAFLEVTLAVQRAFGWVRFSLWATGLSALVLLPVSLIAVWFLGAIGGAAAFAITKCIMSGAQIAFTHTLFRRRTDCAWRWRPVLLSLGACSAASALCRWLFPDSLSSMPLAFISVLLALIATYAAAMVTTPITVDAASDWGRHLGQQLLGRGAGADETGD